MARVIITGPAKRDIQSAFEWWKENRSVEQAVRWYVGIHDAINSLRNTPERCSLALERDLFAQSLRELRFGIGRRATHRAVFAIECDTVVILRVRHTSQDALTLEDLE